MTRLPLLALLALAAACGQQADERAGGALASEAGESAEDGLIECAVANAAAFERVCTVERTGGAQGTELLIRHPSGAFRRFEVASDGSGLVAADGAEPAEVTPIAGGMVEVAVAGDRYRLPAARPGPASGR